MNKYNELESIKVVGIDLAKNVFHLHGVNGQCEGVIRKKLSRRKLVEFMARLPACLVAMEACGGSHDWARRLIAIGHDVRLISPQFVKPYVKEVSGRVEGENFFDSEGTRRAEIAEAALMRAVLTLRFSPRLFKRPIQLSC